MSRKHIGDRFGRLVIIAKLPSVNKNGKLIPMYRCKCDCENIIEVNGNTLGKSRNSCGCLQDESRRKEIDPGTRFGKLEVLKRTDEKKHKCYMYLCKCDCGEEKLVRSDMLRSGEVNSCGCLHDHLFKINVKKAYVKNFVEGTNIPKIISNTLQRNNTSGITGVRWHSRIGKWQASITFKRKNYHLGYFDNLNDACKTRKIAEVKLFGDFLKWYEKNYRTRNNHTKRRGEFVMVEVTTKKSVEVKEELERRTGEQVKIYKGAEDGRYNNEYHAYLKTLNGFQTFGTYGKHYRNSKTLDGLLK